MANRAKENDVLDLAEFGARLADLRREMGYTSPEKLSTAIKEKTGMTISHRSIYRLEHGESTITLSQLVAISITLFHEILHPYLILAIKESALLDFKRMEAMRMQAAEVNFDEAAIKVIERGLQNGSYANNPEEVELHTMTLANHKQSRDDHLGVIEALKGSTDSNTLNEYLDETYLDRIDIMGARPNFSQPAR